MDSINGMSKETFCSLPSENKLDVLFDCLCLLTNEVNKKRKADQVYAVVSGFVGGFVAIVGKGIFWGNK